MTPSPAAAPTTTQAGADPVEAAAAAAAASAAPADDAGVSAALGAAAAALDAALRLQLRQGGAGAGAGAAAGSAGAAAVASLLSSAAAAAAGTAAGAPAPGRASAASGAETDGRSRSVDSLLPEGGEAGARLGGGRAGAEAPDAAAGGAGGEASPPVAAAPAPGAPAASLGHFCGGHAVGHVDFAGGKSDSVFRLQDYCWKEEGFALLARFFPGVATLLDEQFDLIYELTYRTHSGEVDVDTTNYRRAVWFYVYRVLGIQDEDYDYSQINLLMTPALKGYIKKVACLPEDITGADFWGMSQRLKPDERVHIALLALECRKQSELLYALHALMKHMQDAR